MSAYLVEKNVLDYLLAAAFAQRDPGRAEALRWVVPHESGPDVYQEGSPWGPDAQADFRRHKRELMPETADAVGAMLWAENQRSVNHRYAEAASEMDLALTYAFPPHLADLPSQAFEPAQVFETIDNLDYQSCEHPGWDRSEAKAFLQQLREAYCDVVKKAYERRSNKHLVWGAPELPAPPRRRGAATRKGGRS